MSKQKKNWPAQQHNKTQNVPQQNVSDKRIAAFSSYQGPIPPPEIFEKFEKVLSGAGQAILDMAKKEQTHRHQIEEFESKGFVKYLQWGQNYGFVLALASIIGSIILIALDKSFLGAGMFIASLAVLIGVAIWGKNMPEEKSEDEG